MPGDLVKFPFGCVPDDWRVFFVGYLEKGRQGSHVKRVITRFDFVVKEFKIARPNVSYRLKVNEFTAFHYQE